LKILHIAGWYPSKDNPAAGIFVREHVKATALYNDVVVIYSEGVDLGIRSYYQVEDNIEDGIRTLRLRYRKLPVPKTTYFVYLKSMFYAYRKLLKEEFKPALIHAHVYSAGVPAVLIGKRYGIPVIVTEHFSGFPRGLVRGVEKLKAKFTFEQADLVCPVSEDLKRHIEAYGIQARFRVVPNVVDTSLFTSRYRNSMGGYSRKRLLLVALLTPIKGIPYLLEALTLLKKKRDDFVLDIVGDGPCRKDYEEMTHDLGLQEHVRFHGLKTKQEVAEYMGNADIFVLPSEWENMPCVIIEAMSSGLPVVSTNVGGIPEIINDEVGVLVPPKNSVRLVKALDSILNNLPSFSRERIVELARERYSYEAVGEVLNNLYRSTVSN
jgi:glycosyltransferase involved in cell wall biosynthesis